MTELFDSAAQLPHAEFCGVPIRQWLELVLLLFTAYQSGRLAWAAGKGVRYVVRLLVPDAPLPPDATPEKYDFSPVAEQAMLSLQCEEPTYDPRSHCLHCDGLPVRFGSNSPNADVADLWGSPHTDPDGKAVGTDLRGLVSAEEYAALCGHSRELRDEVLKRDVDRANRDAALHIYRERLAADMARSRLETEASYVLSYAEDADALLRQQSAPMPHPPQLLPRADAPAGIPAMVVPSCMKPRKVPVIGGSGRK